jgi:hypothetical protein
VSNCRRGVVSVSGPVRESLAVGEDRPALRIDVGGLQLGEIEIHPAEVLDLGVEGVRRETARADDDPVSAGIVEAGET